MLNDALFVGSQLHEKAIPLPDGSEHTIHFRELAWPEWAAYQLDQRSDDWEVRRMGIARMLAAAVCEPDGSAAMTVERALQLRPQPMNALLDAIIQTHGRLISSAKKPSPSAESSGSGTSSPSDSAAPLENSSAA